MIYPYACQFLFCNDNYKLPCLPTLKVKHKTDFVTNRYLDLFFDSSIRIFGFVNGKLRFS